jgi:hypothetical protein
LTAYDFTGTLRGGLKLVLSCPVPLRDVEESGSRGDLASLGLNLECRAPQGLVHLKGVLTVATVMVQRREAQGYVARRVREVHGGLLLSIAHRAPQFFSASSAALSVNLVVTGSAHATEASGGRQRRDELSWRLVPVVSS